MTMLIIRAQLLRTLQPKLTADDLRKLLLAGTGKETMDLSPIAG